MKKKILFFEDLGKKEYQETWKYQKKLFDDIIQKKINNIPANKAGYLLFVEHPHVYTIGKNGKKDKHLLVSSDFLKKKMFRFLKRIEEGISLTMVLDN